MGRRPGGGATVRARRVRVVRASVRRDGCARARVYRGGGTRAQRASSLSRFDASGGESPCVRGACACVRVVAQTEQRQQHNTTQHTTTTTRRLTRSDDTGRKRKRHARARARSHATAHRRRHPRGGGRAARRDATRRPTVANASTAPWGVRANGRRRASVGVARGDAVFGGRGRRTGVRPEVRSTGSPTSTNYPRKPASCRKG